MGKEITAKLGTFVDVYEAIELLEGKGEENVLSRKLSYKLGRTKNQLESIVTNARKQFRTITQTYTTKDSKGQITGIDQTAILSEIADLKSELEAASIPAFTLDELYSKEKPLVPQRLISALLPFIDEELKD